MNPKKVAVRIVTLVQQKLAARNTVKKRGGKQTLQEQAGYRRVMRVSSPASLLILLLADINCKPSQIVLAAWAQRALNN